MSPKTWSSSAAAWPGIVMRRLVIGRLLGARPSLSRARRGAFVIVAWVGLKLLLEFLRVHGLIHFEVSRVVVLQPDRSDLPDLETGLRETPRSGPTPAEDDEAADLLQGRKER